MLKAQFTIIVQCFQFSRLGIQYLQQQLRFDEILNQPQKIIIIEKFSIGDYENEIGMLRHRVMNINVRN